MKKSHTRADGEVQCPESRQLRDGGGMMSHMGKWDSMPEFMDVIVDPDVAHALGGPLDKLGGDSRFDSGQESYLRGPSALSEVLKEAGIRIFVLNGRHSEPNLPSRNELDRLGVDVLRIGWSSSISKMPRLGDHLPQLIGWDFRSSKLQGSDHFLIFDEDVEGLVQVVFVEVQLHALLDCAATASVVVNSCPHGLVVTQVELNEDVVRGERIRRWEIVHLPDSEFNWLKS
mmetsp:Transcript_51407/g.111595  ORF Transcript_51407/g.111595 Transcript_51407/m.111595 type:complete len:230 (-) Transcript_51407:758-1447(-)